MAIVLMGVAVVASAQQPLTPQDSNAQGTEQTAPAQANPTQGSVVKEIVIQGNQRVSKEAILAAMRTKVGQPYLQENLDRDQKSLEDLGFFRAVSVRGTPQEGNDWKVTVDIDEWPEIKEIRVVGNTVVKTEEIVNAIKNFIKPGDVFNERTTSSAADAILGLYTKKGYYAGPGMITAFAPLRESPNTLNIEIDEVRVGTVQVQGVKTTRNSVMRRLIKTRTGDVFSPTKWTNDLRRLVNTQWFETVRWENTDQTDPDRINLLADVKEAKTGQFNVGVQLDPRNSLAGILKLSDTNFRGTGQTVGVNLTQATQGAGTSVDFDYVNPFFDRHDTSLRASLYSRVVYRFTNAFNSGSLLSSGNTYNERRTGGTLGFSRPLNDNLSLGYSLRVEGVKTNNIDSNGADRFVQQDGDIAVFSLGGIRNRRDRDVDATHGDWFRLDLEPGYANITRVGGAATGADNVLGKSYFFRTNMEYRAYFTNQGRLDPHNMDAAKRVLAIRARYGAIQGTVPFFEQFFVGGSDSLRGYAQDRFWGRTQFLTTAELRFPLQKSFSIVGFVDYGGAWGGYNSINDFTQSAGPQLHIGYGSGLSFKTPLGPIRVDLGFDEHGKSRTNFQIGTSF